MCEPLGPKTTDAQLLRPPFRGCCLLLCLVPSYAKDVLCRLTLRGIYALEGSSLETQKTSEAKRFGVETSGEMVDGLCVEEPATLAIFCE